MGDAKARIRRNAKLTLPATTAITLEDLLCSPAGFALPASSLQRAIARAADGRQIDGALDAEGCERHFGCRPEELGAILPRLVVVVAGVRGGKSLMASAAALKAALSADLSQLVSHEIARVPIVAPTVDNATATYRLLAGAIQTSPVLRPLLVGEPTNDTVMVRRADGRVVEIVVVAAHRGAITIRSRWLAGFVLDEVALFGQEASGAAVNAEELLRAAETRLVKGGQGWLISSPYGPQGLLHQLWKDHFGKPARVLVVHAPTLAMNPAFDPEQVEEIRKRDPDAAAREYDASWVDADTALLSSVHVEAATRKEPAELSPEANHFYACAIDPAFRGNSFTAIVLTKKPIALPDGGSRFRTVVVAAKQWTGSKAAPIAPRQVFSELAALCQPYGISSVESDQYSLDALRAIASEFGLFLFSRPMTPVRKLELFERMRTMLAEGELELPPDPVLRADLLAVRKKVGQNGVTIDLPRTANGRHADYAPALALALGQAVREPEIPKIVHPRGSAAWEAEEAARLKEKAIRDAAVRSKREGRAIVRGGWHHLNRAREW
jgi:hypothetical protein